MGEILGIASPVRVLVAIVTAGFWLISHGLAANEPDLRFARLSAAPDLALHRPDGAEAGPTAADIELYRQIFALQADGRMSEADRLISALTNRVLMGHVLAQRYLHPTAHISTFDELARWLDLYADLPQAGRIHKLAERRRPPFAAAPRPPRRAPLPAAVASTADGESGEIHLAALTSTFPRLPIAPSKPSPRAAKDLATLKETGVAVAGGRDLPPRELWSSGLAAFRLDQHGLAAERFTALVSHPKAGPDEIATASFWAARASLLARRPELMQRYLRVAAGTSDGFYGRLAREMIGDAGGVDESRPPGAEDLAPFGLPATRRAAALLAVGEPGLAVQELTLAAPRAEPEIGDRLLAVAAQLALPDIGGAGRKGAPATYPVPKWQPTGGYTIDRALVWAISRTESNFKTNAVSPRGAVGLMQIMPDTAASVARKLRIPYAGRRSLYHPPTNLRIGQAYLHKLRRIETVGDSLIHMLLAYNAGIGRVETWRRDMADLEADPLLFVETVPIRESRDYVKKVLTSYWVYRDRLGQRSASLASLAANDWPSLEQPEVETAVAETRARPD